MNAGSWFIKTKPRTGKGSGKAASWSEERFADFAAMRPRLIELNRLQTLMVHVYTPASASLEEIAALQALEFGKSE
jgi:hypothetical protein